MTFSTATPAPYRRPRPLSAAQTLLWFVIGIAAMFALVSAIFAIKLSLEGRLPFGDQPIAPTSKTSDRRDTAGAPPVPPVSAPTGNDKAATATTAAPAPTASFVSGAENILPPEVAHLAKNASALGASGDAPPPPVPAPAPTPAAPAAPPPVAAAAPAPSSATPATAVTATINEWAAAWSRKDVAAYLAHYAKDFTPANGMAHDAWVAQRRQRLGRPEPISVAIADLAIRSDGSTAVARFTQTYRAGNQNLKEAKTLDLVQRDGRWQIVAERLGH
ncbi:DUF4440 domain-containing protein [Zoogloea sp.]|uniref:YybH family protein n=1 Tax=Zoogloea sp. TaxID=49181 RepID=UPI0035B48037